MQTNLQKYICTKVFVIWVNDPLKTLFTTTKMVNTFQKQLSLPQHNMIRDEPTRCNATDYMLRRLQAQNEAIILVQAKSDVRVTAELTMDVWKTVEFGEEFLDIFENNTLRVSTELSTIYAVSNLKQYF